MLIIKQLSKDISCNIREAEEKIDTAYSLRSTNPAEAAWYKEMAAAHLGFNAKAHDLIGALITAYKASEDYKNHPEYADGMMAVWTGMHADMIADTARVKAMVDTFK